MHMPIACFWVLLCDDQSIFLGFENYVWSSLFHRSTIFFLDWHSKRYLKLVRAANLSSKNHQANLIDVTLPSWEIEIRDNFSSVKVLFWGKLNEHMPYSFLSLYNVLCQLVWLMQIWVIIVVIVVAANSKCVWHFPCTCRKSCHLFCNNIQLHECFCSTIPLFLIVTRMSWWSFCDRNKTNNGEHTAKTRGEFGENRRG